MTTRQLLLGIELLVLLACLTLALSVVVSKVTRLRRESRTALVARARARIAHRARCG